MSSFDLPNNYLNNLEALLRKNRSHASSSSTTPSVATGDGLKTSSLGDCIKNAN
jgi:hypothetical protein